MIQQIVEQVWDQYDRDKNGALDEHESHDFLCMVLDIHERTLAKEANRTPKEISEEEILKAVDECDKNNDGKITKDEMKEWVIKYMSSNNRF